MDVRDRFQISSRSHDELLPENDAMLIGKIWPKTMGHTQRAVTDEMIQNAACSMKGSTQLE